MDAKDKILDILLWLGTAIVLIVLVATYEAKIYDADKHINVTERQLTATKEKLSDVARQLDKTEEDLAEANELLERFINPIQYRSAAVPLYDIALSKELQQYTFEVCSYYDMTDCYEMVLALMWHESDFTIDAISSTDDYGLMQINKCNHAYLQETLGIADILDPHSNIDGGVYILSTLIEKYEDMHKVLMTYNMGPSKAREHWSNGTYTSNYSRAVESKLELLKELKIE